MNGKSDKEHFDYLDGWRGLAILFVLQSHFLPISGFHSGYMGVHVFFALSGLLMSRILFDKRVLLTVFYKRRISRVIPLFLLYVSLVYAIALILDGDETRYFMYTISFVRTYMPAHPDIWHTGIPIGHIWTLNVEEHSYIFLSLLAIAPFFRGREGYILMFAGIFALAIGYCYYRYPGLSLSKTPNLTTEVASSHILMSAGYYLIKGKISHRVHPLMPVIALVLALLCYTSVMPWYCDKLLTPFLLAFSVNHLSQSPAWMLKLLSLKSLRHMGIYSYSIYIWQQPFYHYGVKPFNDSPLLFANLAYLSIAIVVGYFSFKYFENPLRLWLNKSL